MTKEQERKFWDSMVLDANGCRNWNGSMVHNGYGQYHVTIRGKRQYRAHRVAWSLVNGPIPAGTQVLHRCDNRRCCAVEHLFLGTPDANSKDMVAKGRQTDGKNTPRHEAHYRAKLNKAQVAFIRREASHGANQSALGRRFGVSHAAINNIVKNRSWKEA